MHADKIDPLDLVPTIPDGPIVFVFGAMARGFIEADYVEKSYSFSEYPVRSRTVLRWKRKKNAMR